MTTILIASIVLLNSADNTILVLRRSKTAPRRALEWELPGGHTDMDEAPTDAVARELQEETGISLEPHSVEIFYAEARVIGNKNMVTLFYIGLTTSQEVTLSYEHDQFKWLSPEDAIQELTYEKQHQALTYAQVHGLLL